MAGRYVGLDIGGTKLLVASAEESGQILRRALRPTPASLDEGLAALHEMIEEVLDGVLPLAIGAAAGGPLDHVSGVVSPLHQHEWRDVPLKALMQERWGVPFTVDVDTNVAALGEWRAGEIRSPLLYLTLSTGMGGALLIDGQVYRGDSGAHPEPGHVFVRGGVPCSCGADGCLEAVVSGNGIRQVYGKAPEDLGEAEWSQVALDLGVGLRTFAVLYAPAVIVVGGGIAVARPDVVEAAAGVMREGLRLVPAPEVRVSRLGSETALLGALCIAMSGF